MGSEINYANGFYSVVETRTYRDGLVKMLWQRKEYNPRDDQGAVRLHQSACRGIGTERR